MKNKKKCPFCGKMFHRIGISNHIKAHHGEEYVLSSTAPKENNALTPVEERGQAIPPEVEKLYRAEQKQATYRNVARDLANLIIQVLDLEREY